MQVKLTLSETVTYEGNSRIREAVTKIEHSNFIVILSVMRLMAEWKDKYNIDEPAIIVQLQWVLEAIKQDTRAQVVPTV